MESEKPRKPTPAAYKIAPNILYDGNLYPYLNYAQSGFYAYISSCAAT